MCAPYMRPIVSLSLRSSYGRDSFSFNACSSLSGAEHIPTIVVRAPRNSSEASRNDSATWVSVPPMVALRKKMTRLAFELKGDAWEPFTYGQKAWAFHIANKFNVKLIFYGENGELEYGGSEKYMNAPKEEPEDWEYEYFKSAGVDSLIEIGLERGILSEEEAKSPTMNLYRAPPPEDISEK